MPLKACRACLTTDDDLKLVTNSTLQDVFYALTGIKWHNMYGKPDYLCYQCSASMKKILDFRQKCLQADSALSHLLNTYSKLTQSNVSSLNRSSYNITTKLSLTAITTTNIFVHDKIQNDVDKIGSVNIKSDLLGDIVSHSDLKMEMNENEINNMVLDNEINDIELNNGIYVLIDNDVNGINVSNDVGVDDNRDDNDIDYNNDIKSDSEDDIPLKTLSTKVTNNRPDDRKVKKTHNGSKKEAAVKRVKTKSVKTPKKAQNDASEENDMDKKPIDLELKGVSVEQYARVVVLSKEQQLAELRARALSANYLHSPHRCERCYKGYRDAAAYRNHMEKHDERSGPLPCDVCGLRYERPRQLRAHAQLAHAVKYDCRRCDHRSLTAHLAKNHEKWHRGYTYECNLCGDKFDKPTTLLTHVRKRHRSTHHCARCGDSFVSRHGLATHRRKAHRLARAPSESAPAEQRTCAECDVVFDSCDAWRRHVLRSYTHAQRNKDSDACGACGATFGTRAELALHVRGHLPPPPAPPARAAPRAACQQCGNTYGSGAALRRHEARAHRGLREPRDFVCERCGEAFVSAARLRYHQARHTGLRPHACAVCARRFAQQWQVRQHMRVHTGAAPYGCGECARRFKQRSALTRHLRVHTGVRPYACNYCTKRFTQCNSLKIHVNTVHLKRPHNRRKAEKKIEAIVEAAPNEYQ